MKKFLILFLFVLISATAVSAETLKVRALTPISTQSPIKYISVVALENVSYNGVKFNEGDTLYGEMVDVIQPQKMGKNATFSFKITSYKGSDNVMHDLTQPIIIKYRQQLKPNFERSVFSNGTLEFSPYDVTLMKQSTSVWDFIKKDEFKDAFWQPGWQIKIKSGETFHFNLPE